MTGGMNSHLYKLELCGCKEDILLAKLFNLKKIFFDYDTQMSFLEKAHEIGIIPPLYCKYVIIKMMWSLCLINQYLSAYDENSMNLYWKCY